MRSYRDLVELDKLVIWPTSDPQRATISAEELEGFAPLQTRRPLCGYWRGRLEDDGSSALPHPAELPAEPDPELADLLERGALVQSYRGLSTCRVCGADNGSSELSNGAWCWPSGLAHVVREHGVQLPETFVNSVRAGISVPELPPPGSQVDPDLTAWMTWAAARVAARPPSTGSLSVEHARAVLEKLNTPGSRFELTSFEGRWRLDIQVADNVLTSFSRPQDERGLRIWAGDHRVPTDQVLTMQQAREQATRYARFGCHVELTGLDEHGLWCVQRHGPDFTSGTSFHEPTDAQGWAHIVLRAVAEMVAMSRSMGHSIDLDEPDPLVSLLEPAPGPTGWTRVRAWFWGNPD